MIKNDTIISSFDDKMTLLQWLKKTEKALADSTLENLGLNVVERQLSVQMTFADGTTITSNSVPMDAQQLTPITNNEIDLLF